jgi:biopolymer transport protein ExbD
MAQIEQSDGGKKKKGAQKKMHIHVDFTPMVDMNMLLITFFMLCTTMIKSQTLQITLPTNEKVDETEMNKAKESEGITMIVDVERDTKTGEVIHDANGNPVNVVYYYFGQPVISATENNLQAEYFLGDENKMQRGVRKILHDRNKEVLAKIDELKVKWNNKEFSPNADINDSIYQARAKAIRNDSTIERPVVVIKATPEARWESLISALDEMQINQISRYQIDNMNQVDSAMIIDYRMKHPKSK